MNNKNKENAILENQTVISEAKSEAIAHKDNSLKRLDMSFIKHIELAEYKKSNILAYWIIDFAKYHDDERTFNPNSLKTFKRGDIVKVNLGFNIGTELGGLHYCVVLNKNDNPYSGNLNIIPLSSSKENKVFNKTTCIDLGDELYISLIHKVDTEFEVVRKQLSTLSQLNDNDASKELKKISQRVEYLNKMQTEILKMKHGSIALIHQITTISKQRIYKTPVLSGIKLSNASLDLIDKKIKKLYTK